MINDLAVGAGLTLALAAATCWLLGVPTSHVAETAALYGILALIVWRRIPADHPGPGLGPANRVTLARAALVLPVAALVLQPGIQALDRAYWWTLALATAAMALDFLDGWVARATGTSTAFGARFDMEVDALLLIALSVLVWRSGKVGAWVILIGAIRYVFVASAWVWSELGGPLPESFRRKTVCVVQGVALIVCLAPVVPAPLATAAAALALAALVYSFAVDVRWLFSNPTPIQ